MGNIKIIHRGEVQFISAGIGYINLIMTSGDETCNINATKIRLEQDIILQEGDGAFINGDQFNNELFIENIGSINAEFLLFDLE
ncbi:unnamed protein product [Rotaria sp. Silwood1]|nr:unnamed protein product [Rotaria sp. Silwood1]